MRKTLKLFAWGIALLCATSHITVHADFWQDIGLKKKKGNKKKKKKAAPTGRMNCKKFGSGDKIYYECSSEGKVNHIKASLLGARLGDKNNPHAFNYYRIRDHLIKKRITGNERDGLDNTMLHYALLNGNDRIAKLLINPTKKGHDIAQGGIKVTTQNKFGDTPLHIAIREGKTDIAKMLIPKYKAISIPKKYKMVPQYKKGPLGMKIPVAPKMVTISRVIIERPIDAPNKKGKTPLMIAVENGNKEIVKLLIANKANVNYQIGKGGIKPLPIAVGMGNIPIAMALLDAGADATERDTKGNSLLHLAINLDSDDLVEKLIAKGAKLNIQDAQGNTPTHLAINKKKMKTARMLIKKGASYNLKNKKGLTILDLALNEKRFGLTKLLLSKGAKPSKSGYLHTAIIKKNKKIAALLINAGIDLDKEIGKNKNRPLNLAAYKGENGIIELIIAKNKSLVNKPSGVGWYPLHQAVYYGNLCSAVLLLKAGAKLNVKTTKGSTPLDLAKSQAKKETNKSNKRKKEKIVKYLKKAAKKIAKKKPIPEPKQCKRKKKKREQKKQREKKKKTKSKNKRIVMQ